MSKYGLPEVDRPDAHVYRDEDGYYVVKEEYQKPTNPFERFKLAKDPMKETIHLGGIEEMAEASAADFKAWDEALDNPDEVDQRPKWAGLFHRRKGHYGRYMMRLKIPNGVVTSDQTRHLASVVKSCGEDGCADITTRQNFQLRGIQLKDAPEIIRGVTAQGLCSLQSGLDNVRNATGNPLAGFDPNEVVDTRPHTTAIQDYVTGGGRGNPDIANLGRKWNVCVVGGPDFYEHPDINDLAFIPAQRNGVMGFNILVGGFISSARAAEAIPLDAWVSEGEVVAATAAVITTFRDYGHRGNRQKCRMMWLIDEMGLDKFRAEVASRMPTGEMALAAEVDLIDNSIARRSYLGVHAQKQDGLNWVVSDLHDDFSVSNIFLLFAPSDPFVIVHCITQGINVPGGRLQAEDMEEMADLADMYGSGELRLTVEQNFIIPNVPDGKVDALLSEPLLQRYTPFPGNVVAGMVACTGNQFCGFAQIETKKQAYATAEHLESVLDFPKGDIRMIWTGCPNSCAPVQVADIGLMGCQVKNPTGEKGMVDGVNIFVGGTVGPGGHLKENPEIEKVCFPQNLVFVHACTIAGAYQGFFFADSSFSCRSLVLSFILFLRICASIDLAQFVKLSLHPIPIFPHAGKSISLLNIPRAFPRRWGRRPIFVLVAGTFPHRHLDMPKIDTLSNSFLTVRLLTSLLRDHRTGISIRTLNLLLNFLMTSCALRALPRNPSSKQ